MSAAARPGDQGTGDGAPVELDWATCAGCGGAHRAVKMPDGRIVFTEECPGRDDRRSDLANLVHHAGAAMVLALDSGDWERADYAAGLVLRLRDPKDPA